MKTHKRAAEYKALLQSRSEREPAPNKAQHSDIPGYPGYKATANGEILSVSHNWRGYGERSLDQDTNKDGYFIVRLQIGDKRLVRPVHRLVLLAFRGEPENGYEARHLNGNRKDNRIENLAWGTREENAADREAHGNTACGEKHSEAIKNGIAKSKQGATSPLPWEIGEDGDVFSADSGCVARIVGVADGRPESEANAKLIVHAVNGYGKALQALRDLTAEIKLGTLNVRKDFSLMVAHAAATKVLHESEQSQ